MGAAARLIQQAPTSAPARPADASAEFATLVRQHQAMVFGLAMNFLRDPQAAEEVAQDVFLHLHENLTTLKSPQHITFWLRKVTCHRCIDYSRRRKWTRVSLDDLPEPPAEGQERDPLLARRLSDLVASLPEKARMVVILRYQEDLTPMEIAHALAMPIATVKSHLQRSLGMLREKVARAIGDITL